MGTIASLTEQYQEYRRDRFFREQYNITCRIRQMRFDFKDVIERAQESGASDSDAAISEETLQKLELGLMGSQSPTAIDIPGFQNLRAEHQMEYRQSLAMYQANVEACRVVIRLKQTEMARLTRAHSLSKAESVPIEKLREFSSLEADIRRKEFEIAGFDKLWRRHDTYITQVAQARFAQQLAKQRHNMSKHTKVALDTGELDKAAEALEDVSEYLAEANAESTADEVELPLTNNIGMRGNSSPLESDTEQEQALSQIQQRFLAHTQTQMAEPVSYTQAKPSRTERKKPSTLVVSSASPSSESSVLIPVQQLPSIEEYQQRQHTTSNSRVLHSEDAMLL